MNTEEARNLLNRYADGTLSPEESEAVRLLLAQEPGLEDELKEIKEENRLLGEALAPLRPNQSTRLRLVDHLYGVHQRARALANSWPQRAWSYIRLALSYLSIVVAGVLVWHTPPPAHPALPLAALIIFVVGLMFMLIGRDLLRLEARILNRLAGKETMPTRLEVLTVELFGLLCIGLAFMVYCWRVR